MSGYTTAYFLFRFSKQFNRCVHFDFVNMSTDTPMPSAPEMPSTSNQAISSASSFTDWVSFDNENEAAATKTTSEATSLLGTPTAATPSPTSSSTAYSFTGSALGAGSSANINTNDIKDDNDAKNSNKTTPDEEKNDDSMYECNICLDTAKDAVVSMCGHLFCWPCLHQWLETRPNRKLCPVCKAAISKEKVIPLYGRNSSKQEDPRYLEFTFLMNF